MQGSAHTRDDELGRPDSAAVVPAMQSATGATDTVRPAAADTGTSPGLRWPIFLGALALVVVLYWPSVWMVLARWNSDPTYSHGWLVLAICGWLTWRAWHRGDLHDTRPSFWGLVPLVGASVVWLLARAGGINVIQQLAVPALVLGVAWALFGWRGFLTLLVPIGAVYFVLPAWDYLRLVLQDLTVDVTGVMLNWLGVAAFIQGNRVDLAVGSFFVVEGCSGLHFFMAAAALGTIYAYLYLRRRWAQVLLVATAIAVALVANWIRVTAVIYAGHLTNMESYLIENHYYFGWVVFMVLMIPVYLVGRRLESYAAPLAQDVQRVRNTAVPAHGPLAVAVLGLVVLPPAAAWALANLWTPVLAEPILPERVGHWALTSEPRSDWQPVFQGAALRLSGHYSDGEKGIDTWIVYFPRQTGDSKLVGYGTSMARPQDGRLVAGNGELGELRLQTPRGAQRLIRFRYEVAGRVTTSPHVARLYQVLGNLTGDPQAYGLVISTYCVEDSCDGARRTLQSFSTAIGQRLPVQSDVASR
jgi:exosortase A